MLNFFKKKGTGKRSQNITTVYKRRKTVTHTSCINKNYPEGKQEINIWLAGRGVRTEQMKSEIENFYHFLKYFLGI
jgi:hypothetical protein